MSGELAREVQVQVGSIARLARQDEEGWSQQAEVGKEKDRLVKNGGPNVPSKPEFKNVTVVGYPRRGAARTGSCVIRLR